MKKIRIFIGVIIFFAFQLEPGLTQVYVGLPDTTATIGDTIAVPVLVSQLPDSIFSYQFSLTYDSSKLSYYAFETENSLSEQWQMQPFVNDQNPGKVLLGDFGVKPLSGEGALIFLQFLVIGSHLDSANLHFEEFLFNTGNPQTITEDGVITIFAPLVSVRFLSNVNDSVVAEIDGKERFLPFDTLWYSGTEHEIGTPPVQILNSNRKYLFSAWSDSGDTSHIVVAQSDTLFQCFFDTYFWVELNSDYGDPVGEGWYAAGSEAVVSIDTLINFGDTTRVLFLSWQGTYSSEQASFSFPVNQPINENAYWKRQHFLVVNSQFGNPNGEGWYTEGDTAYFSVDSLEYRQEKERYAFQFWEGVGDGSYSGKNLSAFVIMNNPMIENAVWNHEYFLEVYSFPTEIFNFNQTGWYGADSTLSLTAPEVITFDDKIKYRFAYWLFDEDSLVSNPLLIEMDSSHTAISIYQIDSVLVNIAANFPNVVAQIDSEQFVLPYSGFWKYKSSHQVSVDSIVTFPDSVSRLVFLSWETTDDRIFELNADSVIYETAEFQMQYFLDIKTEPDSLFSFPEIGWYDESDTVSVTEAPKMILVEGDTLRFENWVLDGKPIPGNPISVIMDSAHNALAIYNYWLSLSGIVLDTRDLPVEDVSIILEGGKTDSCISNSQGYYQFYELQPDSYIVRAEVSWGVVNPSYYQIPLIDSSVDTLNFVVTDTVKPFVRVMFPNGREKFYAGETDTLLWLAGDNRALDSVYVELSIDAGSSWKILSKFSDIESDSMQSYVWTVPDTISDVCLFRIEAIDYDGNRATDVSDEYFKIVRHTSVEDELQKKNVPLHFALDQNYPNPFNNSTLISFQLPRSDYVDLEIYNFSGQLVRHLAKGVFEAGRHEVYWHGLDNNGKFVASGIYFYQLRTKRGYRGCRKLLLLK